jgi:hypothetical protein
MTVAATTAPPSAVLARIARAGLAGGAVDFVYAGVVGATLGRGVQQVWQGVAAGWLGPAARQMGWASAALGVVTHFGIATAMAGAYALAAGRAPVLHRRPWLSGTLYGLVLYGVMYRVVLPLRWPETFPRWDGVRSGADVLAHVGVGLAIAYTLRPVAGPRGTTPVNR